MSSPSKPSNDASPQPPGDPNPPTYATFSPSSIGQVTPQTKLRSAILVHQKSPLLAATPPQVTRVLAYSHPFLLPLNKLAGLLTWTTGDSWESFILVASFWAAVMYGDAITRYAGPIIVVSSLILGMYARRYSPLSSTGWTGEKGQKGHKRAESDSNIKHHKSLEEIVEDLKLFTSRCNILLDPFLRLTDFLSTQRTATSATTRPALTVLFIRIIFVLPLWVALTLPPLYILTTKRVVLAVGTVVLSWHSRPARVTRTLLWRSRTVRRICVFVTGLDFGDAPNSKGQQPPPLPPRKKSTQEVAASLAAKRRPESTGVRFTFSIYENQRRWLGIGWTSSMLAYERASWTDEHMNPVPDKERFELPEVEGGASRWRWVQGSSWAIETGDSDTKVPKGASKEEMGWIYYDNKWRDGRRGQDGWGRYTRRRKWYRDAELVESTPSTDTTPAPTPRANPMQPSFPDPNHLTKLSSNTSTASSRDPTLVSSEYAASVASERSEVGDGEDAQSTQSKRSWFKKKNRTKSNAGSVGKETVGSGGTDGGRERNEDDVMTPLERTAREDEWRLGDDIRQHLDI
ncbi:Pex24p-domain-containing protein [Didymella exigua CBS 183.55]|uniref:Pex24p-domain-containing protein n=1 Tax=Didymella exigua CBS 183.55 TaxID=1150837 RepID=A0A6A5RZQ5_9PLEO|nr:Pex24p-domain-containing protein [Didymella exigua CBS 183.55]KAF1933083.1 Pex24p-domain-containing protein [Didymella exigua CBS 183.55]